MLCAFSASLRLCGEMARATLLLASLIHTRAPAARPSISSAPTIRYVRPGPRPHVYALAISASVLLSFFPFCKRDCSPSARKTSCTGAPPKKAIYLAPQRLFPRRNSPTSSGPQPGGSRADLHFGSIVLLLFTAKRHLRSRSKWRSNRAWGRPRSKPVLPEKTNSSPLGMIFACGALALLSVMLHRAQTGSGSVNLGQAPPVSWLRSAAFQSGGRPPSRSLALFLVYWLLPNRKVSAPPVVVPARDGRLA